MTAAAVAVGYCRRGWAPVPIPTGTKAPVIQGWRELRITEATALRYFNGAAQNVGVILGEPSGNLVDVDLDCREAVALADFFLPPTESVFGREGKARSHRLYLAVVPKVIQFEDPQTETMLLELRSTGGQTVFPGSTHESGEAIEWHEDGDQAEVDHEQLTRAAGRLAAACLLARAAPAEGRHDYLLLISGTLVRELGRDGAASILAPVARYILGGLYNKAEGDRLLDDTVRKLGAGEPVSGWPKLAERIGDKRCRKIAEWLGVQTGRAEAQPDQWPEPLDIIGAPELVGWPTLTADCLPEPLYRYVMAEAERLNVDPCPLSAHVLAACSSSISDAFSIKPKQHDPWTQQARIWSCVVKDVGARGTEMIRAAFWPVKERDAELFKEWRREHAAWRERQAANKARKGKEDSQDDPEPTCHRLVTNDATIEAMSEILKDGDGGEHGKLTLLCDELVAFLGGFGRYTDRGAAQRALMLESYDGGPQRVDRVKRGFVYVPNWSVVVAGNIQPRRLAGMAADLTDDGLFQRFLTVHTRPAALGLDDDRPIAPAIGREYRELHERLAGLRPAIGAEGRPAPCFVDTEGRSDRQGFMRLVERLQADPTLPTVIRETAPKWSGLLARLTLVFHLAGLAQRAIPTSDRELCRVAGPTVTAAAAYLRRVALPNLFRLGFETMPEEGAPSGHARWIAGHILAHKAEDITARDIGRAYRPLRGSPGEVAWAMEILVDAGWAVQAEARKDGQRWEINPAVHQRFATAAAQEKARRVAVGEAIKAKVSEL